MSYSFTSPVGAKLLLVDDHDDFRALSVELRQETGYRVLEAGHGLRVLEWWEREDPEAIVLDVNMPRLDGWQTLEKLKLRRSQPEASGLNVLHFGDITVCLAERSAVSLGGPVALTRTEFALLELLARHYGRPVSCETILDTVWGCTNRPNIRTVETHIWRLRGKLGDEGDNPRWIRTVPGAGYQLECDHEPAAA